MATTIINPTPSNSSGNGMGFLIGVILLIIVAGLAFYHGWPALQHLTSSGVQINVPKDINVQVKQSQ
jgi:hypothetical protein